jgi:glyceraldehyde-3-phosphate dehydrogenase type II
MSGMLGGRLAISLKKQDDMVLAAGVIRNSLHLQKIINGYATKNSIPERIYLDADSEVVESVNKAQSKIKFLHINQLNLSDICDIVIDATPSSNDRKWRERYTAFGKYVVFQSGAFPYGNIMAPPHLEMNNHEKIFRQGNCVISALSPIMYAFNEKIKSARINVVMQFAGKLLTDVTTNQRIHSTYLANDLSSQMNSELSVLFPGKEIKICDIYQIPGLDYYSMSLHLKLREQVSGKEIRKLFVNIPRVFIAPNAITSTYEIDHYLREQVKESGNDLAPITIYGCDLEDNIRKKDVLLRTAIYSRTIAVLSNIDAIRILVNGEDPIEAMKKTDQYAGFCW